MSTVSRAIGIEDVAKLAGVSPSTVSYVLNNRGNISKTTADRVRQAAETLHYVPNARARTLVRGVSDTLGVLLPHALAADAFPTELLSGLMAASIDHHHHLMLLSPPKDSPVSYVETLVRSRRVDGIILLDDTGGDIQRALASQDQVPVVVYGAPLKGGGAYTTDWVLDAKTALSYLMTLGHQHIFYLHDVHQSDARRDAIERSMRDTEVQGFTLPVDPCRPDAREDITRLVSPTNYHPSALLTDSLTLAEMAETACQEAGIHVPRQISILAVDLGWRRPPMTRSLTTVSPNLRETGYALAKGLIETTAGTHPTPQTLQGELQIRTSTGVPAMYLTPRTDPAEPVLKSGHTFAIFAPDASLTTAATRQGIYLHDTRMLSQYRWHSDQDESLIPIHQKSTADRIELSYVIQHTGLTRIIQRTMILYPDRLEDRWQWRHYGAIEPWSLSTMFDADFMDIFALRGTPNPKRGHITRIAIENGTQFLYRGLDGVTRSVTMSASIEPVATTPRRWTWSIAPDVRQGELTMTIQWDNPIPDLLSEESPSPVSLPDFALQPPQWERVLHQSRQDFGLLLTDFGQGPVPMAGLPWFGTFFGRDAILSAYSWLTWQPQIARNTLYTLAQYQGTTIDPTREEEPGKMVHELRWGEMTRSDQVPFSRYYGSADVTPLFLMLLFDTWTRTHDTLMMEELWPHAEAAMAWLLTQQDAKTKLFSFTPESHRGLVIQSWKDSFDSMVYHDGHHAEPPLAVAEIQGYAYSALTKMARHYRYRGDLDHAKILESRANQLKRSFNQHFWLPQQHYYALALDQWGHPLDAITSDPGHCLWTAIIDKKHDKNVATRIMQPDIFSGWGIRTLSADEAAYDPFSYHRGSVWPHDTAVAARGLAERGYWKEARTIAHALFDAGSRMPQGRLPELFSGDGAPVGPLPYPEACSPQAWAASAPWWLLTVLTGIHIDAVEQVIHIQRGDGISALFLTISDIVLGDYTATLVFQKGRLTVQNLPQGWVVREHRCK